MYENLKRILQELLRLTEHPDYERIARCSDWINALAEPVALPEHLPHECSLPYVGCSRCPKVEPGKEDFEQMSSEELWDKAYQKGKDDRTAEVKKLIEKELFIAHTEGTPTSRLTSLYNKM